MPRKLPYVSVSPDGDIVIIPLNRKFAAIILAEDYELWCQDPLNFASYVLESKVQIDLMITAIKAEADLQVCDESRLVFRFPNGLRLAVPFLDDDDGFEGDVADDFIALPDVVLRCDVTVEYQPASNESHRFQHGDN